MHAPALSQLHRAVQLRQREKVQALMQAGVPVDAPDMRGRSALHVAASASHADMLALLLVGPRAPSAINARDASDLTPLHIASSRPRGEACARLLIAAGADVNASGPFGVPPLLCAGNYGYRGTRDLLARHGATAVRGQLPEMSQRSTLAHLFGMGGTTVIDGRRISLQSAYPEGTHALLGEAVLACADAAVGLDDTRLAAMREAAAALLRAGDNIGVAAKDLRARIRAGETVILPTGVPGHSTACVWVDGKAMWCDRLMQPSVVIMHRPLGKRRLRRLQRSGVAWTASGVARLGLKHLQGVVMRGLCGRAAHGTPKPQHVGNCAMASAKAALWAVLWARTGHDPDAHHHLYKTATTYARWYHLHGYMERHQRGSEAPADEDLLHACITKLLKPERKIFLHDETMGRELQCALTKAGVAANPTQ